jgi:DNA primase
MSIIPDEKVNEVRERASIVEVVADYVSLRKSGANYQGLCPFHGEKTPSFNVNPARGIFHCFGCGVGGNAITFIMKVEGLSFPDAVKFLAKRVGVTIEERPPTPQEQRRLDEREALYRVNELAAVFYRRVLKEEPAGEAGRRYLERRGVDEATAEAYRLGFAPDRWDALTRHLEQKKVPLGTVETLGLIRRKEGGGYYDTFRNRLLFTIADAQGRPIGFGGRVLDDSLPKYINSPESPVYRKSEVLFGVNLARQAMREEGGAIVVEGYFDHLALYQAGVRHAVATCGTALTGEHLKLLQRYAGKVYTLFDSDSAGRKATCRAMELFLDGALPAFAIELPSGEDPDSFLKKEGSGAFADRLAKARPIFEWFFRHVVRETNVGTVEGKVSVVEELAPRLKKIGNPVERDLYQKEIARVLGINERALARKIGGAAVAAGEFAPSQRGTKKSGTGTEDMLLALMGKYPEVAGKVAAYGVANLFPAEFLPVAEAIIAQSGEGGGIDWGLILDRVTSPEERSRLAALFVDERHLEEIDPAKAFEECRQTRERTLLKEQDQKALQRELAQLDSDSERYWEIMRTLNALRKKKSQLL